jgi:hypothetical protein
MSDEPEAQALFRNPSRMFEDAARTKHAHPQYLAEIFAGTHASETEADAAIDDDAYARFVDQVADAVLAKLEQPSR